MLDKAHSAAKTRLEEMIANTLHVALMLCSRDAVEVVSARELGYTTLKDLNELTIDYKHDDGWLWPNLHYLIACSEVKQNNMQAAVSSTIPSNVLRHVLKTVSQVEQLEAAEGCRGGYVFEGVLSFSLKSMKDFLNRELGK